MGHAAGELAQGFELLRLEQLGAQFLQLQFGVVALGHVAGDLGQADDPALFVVHHVHHRQGPEACAVATHPPALVLGAAGGQRSGQKVRRTAGGAVLVGEEHRQVLADGLFGAVALDPLRAGVPADDAALDRHHIDGVVDHRLDQQLVATCAQVFVGLRGMGSMYTCSGWEPADAGRVNPSGHRAPGRPAPAWRSSRDLQAACHRRTCEEGLQRAVHVGEVIEADQLARFVETDQVAYPGKVAMSAMP